jgi:riboflavin transporter FmnP
MPTSTAYVGEIVDVIIGVATVVTSSLIYKKLHTKRGAFIAMAAGMFMWTLIAVIANWAFVLDFYLEAFFLGNIDDLLGMLSVIPGINESNYMGKYLLYAILPFNLLLSGIVYGITFIVYKRISEFITALNERFAKDTKTKE